MVVKSSRGVPKGGNRHRGLMSSEGLSAEDGTGEPAPGVKSAQVDFWDLPVADEDRCWIERRGGGKEELNGG